MADGALTWLFVSYAVLWAVVITLIIVVVAQLHYMGVIFSALDPVLKFKTPDARLRPMQRLPAVRLVDEWGGLRDVASETGARVLLFVNLTCTACADLLNGVVPVIAGTPDVNRELILVLLDQRERVRQLRERHGIPTTVPVLSDPGAESIQRWGIARTPTAIPIDDAAHVLSILESPTLPLLCDLLGVEAPATAAPSLIQVGSVFRQPEVHLHD